MNPHTLIIDRIGLALVGLILSLNAGAAMADIVVVVSTKNPLTVLSKNQTVDIFLGRTSRFPNGNPAVPVDQVEGSAERNEFYTNYTGKSPAQIKAYWSKIIFTGRGQPPKEVAGNIEVKKRISENPNAVGYIERSQVDGSVKVLSAQ